MPFYVHRICFKCWELGVAYVSLTLDDNFFALIQYSHLFAHFMILRFNDVLVTGKGGAGAG